MAKRPTNKIAETDQSDALALFHPVTAEWFRAVFDNPTSPQRLGWPAIARGENTLILKNSELLAYNRLRRFANWSSRDVRVRA